MPCCGCGDIIITAPCCGCGLVNTAACCGRARCWGDMSRRGMGERRLAGDAWKIAPASPSSCRVRRRDAHVCPHATPATRSLLATACAPRVARRHAWRREAATCTGLSRGGAPTDNTRREKDGVPVARGSRARFGSGRITPAISGRAAPSPLLPLSDAVQEGWTGPCPEVETPTSRVQSHAFPPSTGHCPSIWSRSSRHVRRGHHACIRQHGAGCKRQGGGGDERWQRDASRTTGKSRPESLGVQAA